MLYRIKQVKSENEGKLLFNGWDRVKDGFDLNDYETVYEGDVDGSSTSECLEQLFVTFNTNRPANFYGHSLSVSDVVELDGGSFYCDMTGWVEIESGERI